jgi:hypothetical protein
MTTDCFSFYFVSHQIYFVLFSEEFTSKTNLLIENALGRPFCKRISGHTIKPKMRDFAIGLKL